MRDNTHLTEVELLRNKLRNRGLAVASGQDNTFPNPHGYQIEICDRCGCIVDKAFWQRHISLCPGYVESSTTFKHNNDNKN